VLDIQGQLNDALKIKTWLDQGQLDGTLKTKTQPQSKVLDIQGQLNDALETKPPLLNKVHKTGKRVGNL